MAEKLSLDTNKQVEPKENEEQSSGQSGGAWWDSWLSSAKTKSAEVYSMVKKDLDEIGTAVKSEASHVLNTTSNVIGKTLKLDEPESPANVMKKSFSTFIGQVSTALNPEPDDEDTEVILSSGDTTTLAHYKKELEALQRVDATFIVPADGAEFEAWRATFETPDSDVITLRSAARKLESNPVLKEQYTKLVPDAVSHSVFWERYLFRVALLQDSLAANKKHQDPVLAHLQQTEEPESEVQSMEIISEKPTPDSELNTWEEAEFSSDIELSEEQQIKLLEEYENEISTKKQTKTKDTAKNEPSKKKNKGKKLNEDICDKNLVENHFDNQSSKKIKDDASSHSDESWEKEFEFEEAKAK